MAENAVDMDSIEDAFPLSGSQRGILFHAMQSEVRDTYVAHISLRLDGELDVPAFKAAWDTVIEHQPSLRASFVWEGLDEPLQVIHRDVKPEWRIEEELSSCSLEDVLEAESLRPFQLGQAPLFRFVLYRESARHHRLIWSVHHLLADGWSTPIILEQVLSAYAKSLETTTTTLNAVPVDGYASQKRIPPASTTCVPSYREYVLWQRELDTSEARSYWQNYLRGQAPTPLRLMTKTKPDVNIPLAQRRRVQVLDETQTAALNTMCRTHRTSLAALVIDAWARVLSRYCDSNTPIMGIVTSGRSEALPGIEQGVGLYVNTLPLVAPNVQKRPLDERLGEILSTLQEHGRYDHLPLADIQMFAERDEHEALMDTAVSIGGHGGDLEFGNEQFKASDLDYLIQSHFPLSLLVMPGRQTRLTLVHDPAQIDRARVDAMLASLYIELLGDVDPAAKQDKPISRINTHVAKVQATPLDDAVDLSEEFKKVCDRSPDSIAIVANGQATSYGELDVIVTRVAQTLTGKERLDGTKPGFVSEGNSDLRSVSDPGELIALIVDTSALQLAGLFGILKASCAYLPIDVTLPEARIDSMLTEADVSTIVVSATILQSMPCLQGRCCIVIDELVDMHQQAGADEINATSLETIKQDQPENSDRLAYVMYTSGSSGRPKGVEITHANLIASTRARMSWYGLTAPRYLLMSSIAFDSSVAGIYWTLLSGGVLIMASPDERGDVDAIERLIRDNEVSHLLCLPSLYELLLRQATHKSLHTVRTAIVAGEACGSSLVSLHHEQLHHADLFNEYGPTEATVWSTVHHCEAQSPQAPVPIGRAIPGMQTYVLASDGRVCPFGVIGELHVAGPGLARGYRGESDLTDAAFISAQLEDGDTRRLYRTGDRVCQLENGDLYFLGRSDNQIKLRGHRIDCEDVAAILGRLPGVVRSHVFVAGSGELATLHAAIEYRADAPVSAETVRHFARAQLPAYQVPARISACARLPLTPNGKIDVLALQALDEQSQTQRELPTDMTPRERQLVALWESVLGRTPIGLDDDFFDIGGHSLLAIKLLQRMDSELNIKIPLKLIFEVATIRQLLARVDNLNTRAETSSLMVLRDNGAERRLFLVPPVAQTGMYFNSLLRALSEDIDAWSFDTLTAADHGSIEALAIHYAQEILAVQPHGPWNLLGACFGNHVAHEIARQLPCVAKDDVRLYLIDSAPPLNGPDWAHVSGIEQRREAPLRFYLSRFSALRASGRLSNIVHRQKRRLRALVNPTVRTYNRVQARQILQFAKHRAAPCSADMHLYVSREFSSTPLLLSRWQQLASGRFSYQEMAAQTHQELVTDKSQHWTAIAEDISKRIAQP